MALNNFLLNTYHNLDSRVRSIFERVYPNIAQPDAMSINHPLTELGTFIDNNESKGTNSKLKIVWGSTRMTSKKIVDS